MEEHTQVILPADPTLREGGKIAYVFDDPSVDMGDAILIAAAPELLECLRLLVHQAKWLPEIEYALIQRCKAVMAKAERPSHS